MLLKGKKVAFLGDSITEGSGVADLSNRYDNRLKEMCGLAAVYNDGIGGTRLAHQSTPSESPRWDLSFCGRVYNVNPLADIVVVYGGTNDYGHGNAPFGTEEDTTPATYLGAVYFLMNFLRTFYSDKTVVFLTPARRMNDDAILDDTTAPCNQRRLLPYVEAIQKTAEKFEIPVLDLYHGLGIDPNLEEDRITYAPDGLHLNDAGHAVLAKLLKEFLEAL